MFSWSNMSSMNTFQPARKAEFQSGGKNGATGARGPTHEAARTPVKFKKQPNPIIKKNLLNQNLSSAKALNHSLTSSKAGSNIINSLQNKAGKRVGLHKGSTDLQGVNSREHFLIGESRQMINSPVKTRARKGDATTVLGKKPISTQLDAKHPRTAMKNEFKDEGGGRLFASKSPSKKTIQM